MKTDIQKNKRIQLVLTEDLDSKLQAICKASAETMSDVLRRLIQNEHARMNEDYSKIKTTNELIRDEKYDALVDLIKMKFAIQKETIENSIKKNDKILGLMYWANKTLSGLFYFMFKFLFDRYNVPKEERKKIGEENEAYAREHFQRMCLVIDKQTEDNIEDLIKYLGEN
jgi:regulator of PEP synthase PpsR (kinase-PPPase family)